MQKYYLRVLINALFSVKNVFTLAAGLILMYMLNDGALNDLVTINIGNVGYGVVALIYAVLVGMTMYSKDFNDKLIQKQKKKDIRKLNISIMRAANESKRRLGAAYVKRLKRVLIDKNDILDSYYKNEDNIIKERIVEKTLNLILNYIKLLNNFCIRSRELENIDVGKITEKININSRKLEFIQDYTAQEDLRKMVEIDRNLISQIKDERIELNRISTKLEYMESTVSMFKRQVLSNIESEDMLESIESAVNEAEALDKVLLERRKRKLSM